ncbi:M50 family metallopeptidase [Caldivirga maquilingensis]|uniref:Peptidase M50 n=1 Tax=Caldivirga maquilingensis (strain ATCC 700844 / DSM 13496 / JCM 10307 / IC-167) TaxID=397948 RepID=A8MD24_CALMQ|nr:M50 family metallopeptidase [Caldivirga maquilingensis]ABW01680.1 peptidase M50 [Caldivirga maquilingensis IC-167]
MNISPLVWFVVAWFVFIGLVKLLLGNRVRIYYYIALMARSSGVERVLRPLADLIEGVPAIVIFVIVVVFFALAMVYAVPVLLPMPIQVIGELVGFVPSFIRILGINIAATVSVLTSLHTVSGQQAATQLVQSRFTPATPLIPGVTISVNVFIIVLIAIGISILVHEVSHGIVALRYGGRIKSGGVFLSLFILYGGFVEVDEVDLRKRAGLRGVLAMLSAGVFANMILSIIAIGLMYLALIPALQPYLSGIVITSIVKDSPAFYANIPANSLLLAVNGKPIISSLTLLYVLEGLKPGSQVTLTILHSGIIHTYTIVTSSNPSDPSLPFIGITIGDRLFYQFIYWLWTINVVIILLNTMPAWPLDGGQFLYHILLSIPGFKEDWANWIMYIISAALWVLFVFTLLVSLSSGLWRIAVTPP